jgi:hypothetical protein
MSAALQAYVDLIDIRSRARQMRNAAAAPGRPETAPPAP